LTHSRVNAGLSLVDRITTGKPEECASVCTILTTTASLWDPKIAKAGCVGESIQAKGPLQPLFLMEVRRELFQLSSIHDTASTGSWMDIRQPPLPKLAWTQAKSSVVKEVGGVLMAKCF
jgi:hypothetical protein